MLNVFATQGHVCMLMEHTGAYSLYYEWSVDPYTVDYFGVSCLVLEEII